MCGICGKFNFGVNKELTEQMISRMCSTIVHRGPDAEGIHLGFRSEKGNFKIGLGIRRLAIIDLVTGDQPIHNEDKTIWVVLNGEIYNFRELRNELTGKGHEFYTKSDTEAIVHLYEDYGVECLKYLRGMFAFALWDESKKILFIARDRVGKKPLIYSIKNGSLAFSSELRTLMEQENTASDIDYEALNLYLTFQYIPSPLTIFKGIKKLPPASYMLCDERGNIEIHKYWDINFRNKFSGSFREAEEEFHRIFEEATKIRLISDVPLGAFLSGGIDSSAVVGVMSKYSSAPVKTFSIGFRESEFSETKFANIIAKHFNTEHHEYEVDPQKSDILPKIAWHYSEPFADSSALPSYFVANITRSHVTVALNGDGGDENFGGYLRYMALNASTMLDLVPGLTFILSKMSHLVPLTETNNAKHPLRYYRRFLGAVQSRPEIRNLLWHSYFTNEYKDFIYTDNMKRILSGIDAYEYLSEKFINAPADNILDRSFYTDITAYLPECLLVKMDIATMANSLEARSPFLDHKLMEFAATLPASWKVHLLKTKYFLRKAFDGFLPDGIINRKKQGFGIPLGKWFKGDLNSYIKETLLSRQSLLRGYFEKSSIELLINEHSCGKMDHGYKLWALLMLELWHRVFIDKEAII